MLKITCVYDITFITDEDGQIYVFREGDEFTASEFIELYYKNSTAAKFAYMTKISNRQRIA